MLQSHQIKATLHVDRVTGRKLHDEIFSEMNLPVAGVMGGFEPGAMPDGEVRIEGLVIKWPGEHLTLSDINWERIDLFLLGFTLFGFGGLIGFFFGFVLK
jgi:hypothetical protein